MTGPFSQPKWKSRYTGPLKNRALDDAVRALLGAREGDRAKGTREKAELWKDSSKSSLAGLKDSNKPLAKDEGCGPLIVKAVNGANRLVNCCWMVLIFGPRRGQRMYGIYYRMANTCELIS